MTVAATGAVALLYAGVAFAAGGHSPLGALASSDASTHAAGATHPTHRSND